MRAGAGQPALAAVAGRCFSALPVALILLPLVLLPLLLLIAGGIGSGDRGAWLEIFAGPLSGSLFWRPLAGSLLVAAAAALLATALGGVLALLYQSTDIAGAGWLRPAAPQPQPPAGCRQAAARTGCR